MQLQPAIAAGQTEMALVTEDFRLAIVLIVLGSKLNQTCPVEWVDNHADLESFLNYLKSKHNGGHPPEPKPETKKFFNFSEVSVAQAHIYKAFQTSFEQLTAEYETVLSKVPIEVQDEIKMAVSYLIARACHQVFIERDFLAKELNRMPDSAKWDSISQNGHYVKMGKRCSPEVRHSLLKKLQT